MPRICRTRLRTTVATTARLSVRPVADRVSATREVLGLIRVQPVENSSERVLLRGAPCRHSTTVTGDDITRPGPAGRFGGYSFFKSFNLVRTVSVVGIEALVPSRHESYGY